MMKFSRIVLAFCALGILAGGCTKKKTDLDTTTPDTTPTTTPTTTTENPIVATGLVLNLDASKANGTSAFSSGSGCNAASGSALSWVDLTSNHINGTLTGFGGSCASNVAWNGDGTSTGTGEAGPYRLNFNGTSAYVNMGSTGLPENTAFTIASWVQSNVDGGSWAPITDKYKTGSPDGGTLGLWVSGIGGTTSQFDFPTNGGSGWDDITTTTMSAGVWYYVAATWDGTTKNIYLNGALANSSTPTPGLSPVSGAGNLWLGGRNNSTSFLDGSIAAVQIYSRALTAAEISQNCQAYVARFPGVTCQ